MKKLLLSLVLLNILNSSISQEVTSPTWFHQKPFNTISVSTGLSQIEEGNIFGLPGTGTLLRIAYGRERARDHLGNFNLSLNYSRLRTDLEDVSKSLNVNLNLGYNYNFILVRKQRFTYLLGPEAELNYTLNFFPNWDESHLYWANYLSIGVANYLATTFRNTNLLTVKVSLPVIAVVGRPEMNRLYKIDDLTVGGIIQNFHSNLEAGSWNNLFFYNMQIEYRYRISEQVYQSVGYHFIYQRVETQNTKSYQQLVHLLSIKLYF